MWTKFEQKSEFWMNFWMEFLILDGQKDDILDECICYVSTHFCLVGFLLFIFDGIIALIDD